MGERGHRAAGERETHDDERKSVDLSHRGDIEPRSVKTTCRSVQRIIQKHFIDSL